MVAAVSPEQEVTVAPTRVLAWAFLLAYLLLVGLARATYAGYGVEPSATFELLAMIGLLTFVWYWVTQECRRCGATFPLDFAWFVTILWFILVPYYMWRSQGWRGLAKCGIILAWLIGTRVVSLAVRYGLADRR